MYFHGGVDVVFCRFECSLAERVAGEGGGAQDRSVCVCYVCACFCVLLGLFPAPRTDRRFGSFFW